MLLIELLLYAGAELQFTCTNTLVCHEPIKALVQRLGIYSSYEEILTNYQRNYFDVVLDCGAFLVNDLLPKEGFVELTHVDLSVYKNTNCTVTLIDNSFVKRLETSYGTGDGFVRAIAKICSQDRGNFRDQTYMVFGYGKVGEGICMCLNQAEIPKNKIIVVEVEEKHLYSAQKKGFLAYSLKENQGKITELLKTSVDCAVTATGIQGSISHFFQAEVFANIKYLCNMGTYDEWGEHFPNEMILFNKQPLNFMLAYPTRILYLDPSFALLAHAALDLLKQKSDKQQRLRAPDLMTQKKIFDIWVNYNDYQRKVKQQWVDIQAVALEIN